jgi:hypothetical protein
MAAKTREGTSAGPRSDAYTGMLLISLLAQITGVVFLYLDWSQYPAEKPKEPPAITVGAGPGGGPGPGATGPGAPGGPPPGGAPKGPAGK